MNVVLENFESISGCVSKSEALLNVSEPEKMLEFVKRLVSDRSWILIASRSDDCRQKLMNLQVLNAEDATSYAKEVFDAEDNDMSVI